MRENKIKSLKITIFFNVSHKIHEILQFSTREYREFIFFRENFTKTVGKELLTVQQLPIGTIKTRSVTFQMIKCADFKQLIDRLGLACL